MRSWRSIGRRLFASGLRLRALYPAHRLRSPVSWLTARGPIADNRYHVSRRRFSRSGNRPDSVVTRSSAAVTQTGVECSRHQRGNADICASGGVSMKACGSVSNTRRESSNSTTSSRRAPPSTLGAKACRCAIRLAASCCSQDQGRHLIFGRIERTGEGGSVR